MRPDLDNVRRELAETHDQILALPADDFAKRSELDERRSAGMGIDEVEARVKEIIDPMRSSR